MSDTSSNNLRNPFARAVSDSPEVRLAVRISAAVLAILLAAVALASVFAYRADEDRKFRIFQSREAALRSRPAMLEILANPRMDVSNRMGERRGPFSEFRNLAIVFPDGTVESGGMLDGASLSSALSGLPLRAIESRTVGGERFSFYAFPFGNGRTVVTYEPSALIEGPRKEALTSLFLGVLVFSVLLFFVSRKIARGVIRPIEELADRERAYARHIAHELKTPLSVIRSELELARAIPAEGEGRILSALEEADAMRGCVDDLLLLAVSEGGISKESLDLVAAIRVELAKNAENDTVSWKIETPAEDVRIVADPRLVRTYLRNVFANVRAHALPGTLAEIRVSESRLTVANRSGKLPKEVLDRPFDAFVGTPGKGSGIGLSIVKRIADLHGWKVSFSERSGTVALVTEFEP